ncbi:MAG: hypothetical protein ACK5Q5_14575 [Planctomycetaceae bacterium]
MDCPRKLKHLNSVAAIEAHDLRDFTVWTQFLSRWNEIETSKYTATPASTSTVTLSDTSDMKVGLPVRYTYNGNTNYGIITAVSANTSITVAGAALDTGHALTELSVGCPEMVVQVPFFVLGLYGDGAADLLLSDMYTYFRWKLARAYLVRYEATHQTADTGGAQPKLNVKVDGNLVGTEDSNNGIQLSSAGTWVQSSAVAISNSNYVVDRDDAIEVRCTVAGTNSNARHLSGNMIFVLG